MKKLNILIIVFAVIFLGLTALLNWQYDNIKALYYAYKYANEDIDSTINSHYEEVDKYLAENGEYEVRQSTRVEEKLHQMNLLSDDEFIELLTGKKQMTEIFGMDIDIDDSGNLIKSDGSKLTQKDIESAKDTVSSSQTGQPDNSGTTQNPASNDKVSECIAKMYVLKSTFESKLDGLYAEAKATYVALSPEERKNSKSELIKTFYGRATSLERSCDAQVNQVLAELETALKESGESLELVTKIRNAYNEEKSLKKAYYINLYKS